MTDEFADAVFDAIESGDVDAIAAMWDDDGRTADLPAAICVGRRDGKVVRIDEYLDSAHVTAAFRN